MEIPFRTGDRVIHKKTKEKHIIYQAAICGAGGEYSFEYHTNKIAWLDHHELQLVESANDQTIRELILALVDDNEIED